MSHLRQFRLLFQCDDPCQWFYGLLGPDTLLPINPFRKEEEDFRLLDKNTSNLTNKMSREDASYVSQINEMINVERRKLYFEIESRASTLDG